jgi:uncharacterized protein YijF (DUF1287 family)
MFGSKMVMPQSVWAPRPCSTFLQDTARALPSGPTADKADVSTGNRMAVQNIGAGPELEDILFDYPITGHYRYVP